MRKIYNGMGKRPSLMGGAAREGLDTHLLHVLAEFTDRHQFKSFTLVGPPPRRVSLAMALAILAQPHVCITFSDLDPVGPANLNPRINGYREEPVIIEHEALCDALALSSWELDQLRDDIDRNVSNLLKQQRALRWLWARYAEPNEGADSLLNILFSGITNEGSGLYGAAGQLYGLLNGECRIGPSSLYTPHPIDSNEDRVNPRLTFYGRYVDQSLIHALAKGIGADEEEVQALLDTMICCIPQQQAQSFIDHDQWRIRSFDGMTGLTRGYSATRWLFQEVKSDFLRPLHDWLEWQDGRITPDLVESRLDRELIPRISSVLQQLMGQGLSNLLMEDYHRPAFQKYPWVQLGDLDLLQLPQRIHAVAQPLLAWPTSADAHQTLQSILNLSAADAKIAQQQIHDIWTKRYRTLWAEGPRPEGHQTTLTRLMAHMSRTTISLRKMWHRKPIYDIPHRNILALFTGFYFSDLPLERTWKDAGDAIGADPLGQWFWPTWERLLNTLEDATLSTFTDFD